MKNIASFIFVSALCLVLSAGSVFAAPLRDHRLTRPEFSPAAVKPGHDITISATLSYKQKGSDWLPCGSNPMKVTIKWQSPVGRTDEFDCITDANGEVILTVAVPSNARPGAKPHVVIRSVARLNGGNPSQGSFLIIR